MTDQNTDPFQPQATSEQRYIHVHFYFQGEFFVNFRLTSRVSMRRPMAIFSERSGISLNELTFTYNSRIIDPADYVRNLNMQDFDFIHVTHREQQLHPRRVPFQEIPLHKLKPNF